MALTDEFDMDEDTPFKDEITEIIIPDDPTLDDIIRFALTTFKDHVDDTHTIEPKFKARNLEVACTYLKIAQDALKDKKELEQKDRKLDIDEFTAVKRVTPEKGGDRPGVKSRNEILTEIHTEIKDKD
jgi:hypothetical protein